MLAPNFRVWYNVLSVSLEKSVDTEEKIVRKIQKNRLLLTKVNLKSGILTSQKNSVDTDITVKSESDGLKRQIH